MSPASHRRFLYGPIAIGLLVLPVMGQTTLPQPPPSGKADGSKVLPAPKSSAYRDGRPVAKFRLDALDHGVVLHHGDGPERCDIYGARDVWVYQAAGIYFMHYDAAGPKGWLAALATSKDLIHWQKKGPVLELGQPGENDSASASYGTTFCDGKTWHMFYLGTPHVTPPPDLVPAFPYLTLKAKSTSPAGPWTKQKEVTPFQAKSGTYYSVTASPGQIVKQGDVYRMFFTPRQTIPSGEPSASLARRISTVPGPLIPSPFCPPPSKWRTPPSTSSRRTRPGFCSPTMWAWRASSTPTQCGFTGARTWTAGTRPTRLWFWMGATVPGPSTSSACPPCSGLAAGWPCSTTATRRRRYPRASRVT